MDQEKRAIMLGTAPIPNVLLKLAAPAMIGMMVSAIYNVVDALFVSRLGTAAMGAATIVMPLFMIISALGMMFGVGAASYISRLLGQQEVEKANQTAIIALVSSVIFAITFAIIGVTMLDRILMLFGATPTILPYAKDYARVLISGSIFTMVNMTLNNTLRAEGSAKISMIGIATGAVLNIILDPIFIFTFGFGIKGAALATVLAQAVSTVILLGYYLRKKSYLRLKLSNFRFSGEIYSEIIKIGGPTLIRQGLSSLGLGMINTAAGAYGDVAVAAMGISGRIFMMCFFLLLGFSQGFQPIAGFNYGAKNFGRVREVLITSIRWGTVYCIAVTGILYFGARTLIGGFTTDEAVLNIGVRAIYFQAAAFPFVAFMIMYNSLFMALGRARVAAILSMARQGLFLIPAILVLPRIMGLNGVIFAQPLANILTILVTYYYARQINRELKIHDEGPEKTFVAS